MESLISQDKKNEIKQLFKDQNVHKLLLQQIQQVFSKCLSVMIIYQKIFLKIQHHPKNSLLHVQDHQNSLFMIKINKNFPLQGSVRVYLLDGCYQPKIYDTRDLTYQILGDIWTWKRRLVDILSSIKQFQHKLIKRHDNYLALQRTGQFIRGDYFVYNQLQEHSSLSLFIDRSKQTTNTLIGVSQTHLLIFKKVLQKNKISNSQLKSKSLYGQTFFLTKFCQLQCIQSININVQTNQVVLTIRKYQSAKYFNEFESMTTKYLFNDHVNFIRCILKSITKFQPMKIQFIPFIDKQFTQDSSIQQILQLNMLESRLQLEINGEKKDEMLACLNKSYQKLIEFYSARANPYYLIYVNKLNWLYNKYFVSKFEQ